MTNAKNTRKALLMSAVSLLLCFAMLLGTTFAWFTDSATSGTNMIQAGNLKIDIIDASGASLVGDKLMFQDKNGNTNILWEPGVTFRTQAFKIKNAGSLALKFTMSLNGIKGDSELLDVISFSVVKDDGTAVDLDSFVGTLTAGNTTDFYYIQGVMATTAGNEYQGKTLEGIGITVSATQQTYETDSFDDQYDKDSEYPVIFTEEIEAGAGYAEFVAALANGGNILIKGSLDLTDPANGNTYLTVTKDANIYANENVELSFGETALINGDGTLTIKGGNLKTTYELCTTDEATLVIDGGTHNFGAFSATGNGSIVVNGGTLNCRGTYAGVLGISFGETGSLVVNDGVLNMYEPFNLNENRCDDAYIEINGGKINLLANADKLFAVRNIMDKDLTSGVLRGSSIKITGGVFTAAYPMDDTGDANAFIRNEDGSCDTTRVLVGNTYNGVAQYNCVVTGGTFYGCWTRTGETGGDGTEVCENTIAGFVDNGYHFETTADGAYTVVKGGIYNSAVMGGLYEYLPTLRSGDVLILPEGTYTTTGTFPVPAGVTIKGAEGANVIIRQESAAQDDIFNCAGDATFENIIFESNRKGYAIADNTKEHKPSGNITVINCTFKGIASEKNYGIYKNLNGNLTLKDCTFDNYNNAVCGVNNGNGSTTVITGCTFTNINGEAIGYVTSGMPANFETEVIANNTGLTAENVIGY